MKAQKKGKKTKGKEKDKKKKKKVNSHLRPDQINLLLLGFAGHILGPVEKKLNQVKG